MLSEKSPISTGYNHHKQVSGCSYHKVWAFLVCMVIGVWRYLLIHIQGLAHTFFLWYGYCTKDSIMREFEIKINKNVEFVSVDDFFEFSVKYYDLYSSTNTVLESKEFIVDWYTSGIWLINDNKLLIKKDGNWIDISERISTFLDWQNPDAIEFPISLKMLFNATVDSLKGNGHDGPHVINQSIRISEIAKLYSEKAVQEEQKFIQDKLDEVIFENLKEKFFDYYKKKKQIPNNKSNEVE